LKDQWVGNNIDLSKLSQGIEHFFKEIDFVVRMEQTPKGYKFDVASTGLGITQLRFTVRILGQPSDFTIEFIPRYRTGGRFSPGMVIGQIMSMFGGGVLLLRDVKLQESLDKLEQQFWEHMDKQVAELTNSASQLK
jgi:hypothetical protein